MPNICLPLITQTQYGIGGIIDAGFRLYHCLRLLAHLCALVVNFLSYNCNGNNNQNLAPQVVLTNIYI
jgi:hypothetical protein